MHGTHVAGHRGRDDNRVGMAGVSWGARVLPVKALNAGGAGSGCDLISGILYASSQRAQITNMSLGGPGPCPAAVQEAINVAQAVGVLHVAAAGNSGADCNTTATPANCEGTLGVGATDQADNGAAFSNFADYVDVSAPGVDILSIVIDPKTGQHGYAELSGTSMASPMIAGLAALLMSRHPTWAPQQVSERIIATSRDLGLRGWGPLFGAGRIDAARALS
jgi:serine protease